MDNEKLYSNNGNTELDLGSGEMKITGAQFQIGSKNAPWTHVGKDRVDSDPNYWIGTSSEELKTFDGSSATWTDASLKTEAKNNVTITIGKNTIEVTPDGVNIQVGN